MKVFNIFTSLNFGGVESHASIINANKTSLTQHSFIAISTGGKAADIINLASLEVILKAANL